MIVVIRNNWEAARFARFWRGGGRAKQRRMGGGSASCGKKKATIRRKIIRSFLISWFQKEKDGVGVGEGGGGRKHPLIVLFTHELTRESFGSGSPRP